MARALQFLVVLVGAVGTPGGTAPNAANKFVPVPPLMPPPAKVWNELLIPPEYPLAFFEMSFLLPHFSKKAAASWRCILPGFTIPVWTNPDGMSWIEMLSDESKVERHACLTPTWSETAWFADYVLADGSRLRAPRSDEPGDSGGALDRLSPADFARRVGKRRQKFATTYEAHEAAGIGQVWEEDEFWIELSWRVDPDGSLGIRKHFESPYEPGKKMTVDDYYRWIFENSVPGLPEAAAKEDLKPLEYMRKYGAFLIEDNVYRVHETGIKSSDLAESITDPRQRIRFEKRRRPRRRGRRQSLRRLSHAVAQARIFFEDAERLEMAGTRNSGLHQEPRPSGQYRSYCGRDAVASDVSLADLDSHALGQRQMAVRNLKPQSALAQFERRRESRCQNRRSFEGSHRDRLLHRQSLGHRRHQAGRRRLLAPSLAAGAWPKIRAASAGPPRWSI